jgi:hypothetical protein
MPSPSTSPNTHEINRHARDQPPEIGAADGIPNFTEREPAQGKPHKNGANYQAEP